MAQLATCPGCTSQLALPEAATLSDRVRCPRCGQKFLLMESVQFSIPNAELVVEEEIEETKPYRSSLQPVPGAETYEPAPYESETYDDPYESTKDVEETENAPFPASATLSDWEARLKKAIAATPEEPAEEAAEPFEESSSFEKPPATEKFSLPDYAALKESLSAKLNSVEQDFEVPEADLTPTKPFPSRVTLESWSAADEYTPESLDAAEEEATVSTSFDQTVTDGPSVVAVDTGITTSPRRKKKRSIARTLASASLGVVGIPLGLYTLLWLRGPAGDMAGIAQYLPSFMLPASFSELDDSNAQALVADDLESAEDELVEDMAETLPENDAATPLAEAQPETILDDPEVEPATATAPAPEQVTYQGPKFKLVEPAEFNALFAAAEQAAPVLAEGDLNSKESVAKKGQAYMTFAKLAEKFSYINQPGQTLDQAAQAALAQQLIRTTLRKDVVKRDLPQIALRWWQYPERPSNGIVLIGKIERLDTTDAGTVAIASLGIDGVAPSVPILLGNTEHQEGDIIGVVGTIMVNPVEQLGDVDPGLGPLLISQYSFPLELFANIPMPTDSTDPAALSVPNR
jgi:DNA-directed RNA polymerase subunit RPC12/RpoP